MKSFRTRPLPEPPEDLLRFAEELNADRSGPPLSPGQSRENLKQELNYPDMLIRLEQQVA